MLCVCSGTTASRNLHNSALKRLVEAPMSLFDTTPLGRHSSRMGKDVDSIDNRLNDSLRMVLATLAQIVASIVMIAIVCESLRSLNPIHAQTN